MIRSFVRFALLVATVACADAEEQTLDYKALIGTWDGTPEVIAAGMPMQITFAEANVVEMVNKQGPFELKVVYRVEITGQTMRPVEVIEKMLMDQDVTESERKNLELNKDNGINDYHVQTIGDRDLILVTKSAFKTTKPDDMLLLRYRKR